MTPTGAIVGLSDDAVPRPRFDAPWQMWLTGMSGFVIATFLVILVVLMALGVAVWVSGKVTAGGRAQSVGIGGFFWGAFGAVLVGVFAAAVAWSTDIGPAWMSW